MTIPERINDVQAAILQAELASAREPGSVQLLAVSKGQGIDAIKAAFSAGLSAFGESYLQEAREKITALSSFPIEWHFIGPIQSNKAKVIAQQFNWVHSVYRKKIAWQLNEARSQTLPRLNICLQVNMDNQKEAGISPSELAEFAQYILTLPRLHLRGLMMIPNPDLDENQLYLTFFQLANMLRSLNTQLHLYLDILSMGMSDDLQIAIRAGSTMIRIGRAIFGERTL